MKAWVKLRREMQRVDESLRAEMAARILALPDNPKVHRLSDSPRCFVVQFKDLGNNWTPHYHDFKGQYKIAADLFTQRKNGLNGHGYVHSFEAACRTLVQMIRTGKYRVNSMWTMVIHPDVRKSLRHAYLGL